MLLPKHEAAMATVGTTDTASNRRRADCKPKPNPTTFANEAPVSTSTARWFHFPEAVKQQDTRKQLFHAESHANTKLQLFLFII
jgi:hypothetical protein